MSVKLHSSFISKVSHLFISSLISEKNLHLIQTVLDPQQGQSVRKYPYQSILLENFITMTLYCPGIVFFNIKKKSQKYIDFDKMFCTCSLLKRMQFVHNIAAYLKNRQVNNYQPLAFEMKAFCLGTPVAFPQHVLLDFNKQIAQITQRQL